MGMFNWTGISGVDPRPYATAIKYYCPRPGWGYPSNGENETTIYCQQDGTWSNDANIETCISMLLLIFLVVGINKCLFPELPCPSAPPPAPDGEGSERIFGAEITLYRRGS